MNPIVSGFPHSVRSDGRDKPIETGFRTWLQIARCLDDPSVTAQSKFMHLVTLSGIERTDDAQDFEALMCFMRCGKEHSKGSKSPRPFDFDYDSHEIIASFMQQYGIDLTSSDTKMHWWMFMCLLRALDEDTPLAKLMRVRMEELPSGNDKASKKQRDRLVEAKRAARLPSKGYADKAARDRQIWGD